MGRAGGAAAELSVQFRPGVPRKGPSVGQYEPSAGCCRLHSAGASAKGAASKTVPKGEAVRSSRRADELGDVIAVRGASKSASNFVLRGAF
jgi:hypothetical protein